MKFWNVAVAFFVFMTTNLAIYRRDWNAKLTARASKAKAFETASDDKKFKKTEGNR